MVQGLAELLDKVVVRAVMDEPIPDLTLGFSDDLQLRLFCDQTNIETNDDNYSLRVGDTIYAVAARGHIVVEKRSSQ
jgi:hypothetical protein